MWKLVNGKLIQETDSTRIKFRTNISKSLLNQLNNLSSEYDTYANYLIESGLRELLSRNVISFNKDLRPKDRIQYKTTYDKELLEEVKEFAKNHNLFINDVIEYSTKYIDMENIKDKSYKHRIE